MRSQRSAKSEPSAEPSGSEGAAPVRRDLLVRRGGNDLSQYGDLVERRRRAAAAATAPPAADADQQHTAEGRDLILRVEKKAAPALPAAALSPGAGSGSPVTADALRRRAAQVHTVSMRELEDVKASLLRDSPKTRCDDVDWRNAATSPTGEAAAAAAARSAPAEEGGAEFSFATPAVLSPSF